MARLPRLVVPHQPHHIIQSGIDGLTVFRDPEDHQAFLRWLREAARHFGVAVHAYVLMPDHLHLLATPQDEAGLGKMMQWIGRKYVPYFNARYGRSGTLWKSRYKATVIESDRYFLLCSRYIESKPVMDGLVAAPQDYAWSSFVHHAGGRPDPVITDHALFWALGNTPFDREAAYRHLMEQLPGQDDVRMLNEATRKGWALGSSSFKALLNKQLGRRVDPAPRGRPRGDPGSSPPPAAPKYAE
ncbi:MAG TPA: transposase [Noviherbaspirillum sp.]|jgi:putative transposase|uniref:transposase n=1 Tax=Noviherbaspirillum sp. TaxID=1926288 RepID=UPI002F93D083